MSKKIGTVAILALAALSSTSAQEEFTKCSGPEEITCNAGLECVEKDEFYAECRPIGAELPSEKWSGNILAAGGDDDVEMEMDDGADEEDDVMEEMGDDDDAMAPVGGAMMPPAMLPTMLPAADDVKYMAVIAKDYIPSDDPLMPNAVMVEDLPDGGSLEDDQKACEMKCSMTPGCNAASFYLDGTAFGNKNCWLKTLADVCELPSDAIDDPNAVLLLQDDPACDDLLAMGPMAGFAEGPIGAMGPVAAMAPMAEAPLGVGIRGVGDGVGGDDDLDDNDDDDTTATPLTGGQAPLGGTSPPGGVASTPSGADVSVRGAFIALAVAGGAAVFF